MYVDYVSILDLRCFSRQWIQFVHPDTEATHRLPNVTVLVGNNGVGKTTVLRAICLAVLNQALEQSGYVPYSMIRRTKRSRDEYETASVDANIVVHAQDLVGKLGEQPRRTVRGCATICRIGDVERINGDACFESGIEPGFEPIHPQLVEQLHRDDSPGILVLGYGASRRIDPASEFFPGRRRKLRLRRYERVASLFEEQVSLVPLAGWLPDLQRERPKLYSRVCELLGRLIPDLRFTARLDGDEYLFERNQIEVGFGALSDGYRGYIGLLGDLFYHLCHGLDDDDDPTHSRGIVLVDEIGLHLHPAWQRVVVPTLATALPNLQFVCTTHSPIVAGTVYADNLRLLEFENDVAHVVPIETEIHGLNADQILLSDAFGLSSSRAQDIADRMEELRRGLTHDNWQDSLRLMQIINHGAAGDRPPAPTEPPPEWVRKLARQRKQASVAEDSPRKPSKRSPAKKSSTKKRSS